MKVAEGALYPTLSLQGSVQQNNESSLLGLKSFNALVLGQLTVPIYQGGSEYSLIRQNKETLGQRRLDLDTARDAVRQNIVQSWGQLEAAKANIEATQAQVQASEIALNGVREEARVGQRTTLDVLNAQQELVNARVALVSAQRDRVVASYTLLVVGRAALAAGPRTAGADLRCRRALSPGARQLGRRAHAGRSLKATQSRTLAAPAGHFRVHSSLHGHVVPSAKPAPLWRINGMRQQFARQMAVRFAVRNAGSVSGFLGDDADGEGPRAIDGGNPCLHPTDHCRRRRQAWPRRRKPRRQPSNRPRPRQAAPPAAPAKPAGSAGVQVCVARRGRQQPG